MKEEDLLFHSNSYDSTPVRIPGGMEDRDAAYGPQPPASSKDAPMCAIEKPRRKKDATGSQTNSGCGELAAVSR